MITFSDIFPHRKPVVAVIHLQALPGAPLFKGKLEAVYEQALEEARLFVAGGVDALIVENFRDLPFFPERVPSETIASMAAICREIKQAVQVPLGVNVLRNDADAALGIALAVGAQFIRVNVHNAAALTDQGIVQGRAYETLRKRQALGAQVLILADVAVKHAAPIAPISLADSVRDLSERSLADAIIVSGAGTGLAASMDDLRVTKENTHLPVLIGSGTTPDNLPNLNKYADGYIVGSHFKVGGKADHAVDAARVRGFMEGYQKLQGK